MAKLETKIYDARISDLTETEHNPRQISKKDFAKLKKSLKEFPEMLDIRGVRVLQRNHIGQLGINRGNAGVPPIQCVAQGLQGSPKRACILQRESKKYQKQFPGVCGRGKRG